MSNIARVPEELNVGRSDPIYMAHAYLTKVPVSAIVPFLQAYSKPGDIVVDPFAGSGMTGVAAALTGRSARLSDISILGQHVGSGYVNLVDPLEFTVTAAQVVKQTKQRVGNIYSVTSMDGESTGQLAKTVWSVLVKCPNCATLVNYYKALESAGWTKPNMVCPGCDSPVSSRNERVGEEAVLDYVSFDHERVQIEQPHKPSLRLLPDMDSVRYPRVEIPDDRQMYLASALAKSGLTSVASYYSSRNLYVLTTLWEEIAKVENDAIRRKLLFAFTACLSRASKRYQWSKARPLNAANANYYVAAVFYEWNVFELFERKLTSVMKSDEFLRSERARHGVPGVTPVLDVTYETGSADRIALHDGSVDYVFTDPPFGSNLFYADMSLFQEAWLPGFTDVTLEAVIDRTRSGSRTAARYEGLLGASLAECRRVLKPGGRLSMVFGNSSGKIWAMVQRAVADAGLEVIPEDLVVLNKGQRSVKGLTSGFEHTATLDLILTMRSSQGKPKTPPIQPTRDQHEEIVARLVSESEGLSPSHLYLELLRSAFRNNWSVESLDLKSIISQLSIGGFDLDAQSGLIVRAR